MSRVAAALPSTIYAQTLGRDPRLALPLVAIMMRRDSFDSWLRETIDFWTPLLRWERRFLQP